MLSPVYSHNLSNANSPAFSLSPELVIASEPSSPASPQQPLQPPQYPQSQQKQPHPHQPHPHQPNPHQPHLHQPHAHQPHPHQQSLQLSLDNDGIMGQKRSSLEDVSMQPKKISKLDMVII